MVPKPRNRYLGLSIGFRAVLFRMVPKLAGIGGFRFGSFRAVLFRMVPKHVK